MSKAKKKPKPTPEERVARLVEDRTRRNLGTATVERILRADGSADISASGTQRIMDWPLRVMHSRGLLGGGEEARLRMEAGERFYAHWYSSGLSDLPGRGWDEASSGTGRTPGLAHSERQADHLRQFRRARLHLGADRIALVTERIVLDEWTAAEVGARVFGRRSRTAVGALVAEYLIDGLDRLRKCWSM